MDVVVMKFGGTSVADATAIGRVTQIVGRAVRRGVRPVVVVSAMSGVTDALLALAAGAARGDTVSAERSLQRLRQRHLDAAVQLGASCDGALPRVIDDQFSRLEALVEGIRTSGEADARSVDEVAAIGELANSRIVAAALRAAGLPGQFVDATSVVITDANHTKASPIADAIRDAAAQTVVPLLRSRSIPVIGGFVGRTVDGATTTLGRGGSDFSASLIGAAIDASEIQIWTDVDGMLTGDPRLIEDPRLVDELSFDEASELAYFGAKVLHPSTILPAVARDIPVRILNSCRPDARGTLITSRGGAVADERPVAAVACKRGITVIDITSTRMLMAHGFLRRVFETFEQFQTPVDVVTTSEVSVSVTVDDAGQVPRIASALREFATVTVEPEMAILCAVGENLRRRPDAVARVIGALSEFPLRMISQAASRRNLTIVLSDQLAVAATRQLHDEFFRAAAVL
jgi:aspartate kinase